MLNRSRRGFLETALGAAGAALLTAGTSLQAQPHEPGELATSGIDQPELAGLDDLMTRFVKQQQVPGAALAVTKDGRLAYARGFGLADRERQHVVQPTALFRIASLSKPITAVAVLQLAEGRKVALDAGVWDLLGLPEPSDDRWKQVTILNLLQHTGGWDSEKSFDPMFRAAAIARALPVDPPVEPHHIVRFMLGQPFDFDPGTRYAYSNFGYCLLGRVIERASGVAYERYVQEHVLAPLGIRRMRLGKTLAAQRAATEVLYYADKDGAGPAVVGPTGETVPWPSGAWSLEAMDATGGWLASAVDLARFAAAFDVPETCKVLQPASIAIMFARPEGAAGHEADGKPKADYYGCGWRVRPTSRPDHVHAWHTGSLAGNSTLLVRKCDGTAWAALFNTHAVPDGQRPANKIEGVLHEAVTRQKIWPNVDQFRQLL